MLSETDIQQIAEIDRLNMAGMMLAMGNVYRVEKRKADVLKEMERDTKFVTLIRGDNMLAYLSYRINGDEITIKSIQLAPDANRIILRALVAKVLLAVKNENFIAIRSKVFANNKSSLDFHQKLGFALKEEKDGICYFYIDKEQLLHRLHNMTGNT